MKRGKEQAITGLGRLMPPILEHVLIYFDQHGMTKKEAELFFQQQINNGWTTKSGVPIRNWKTTACDWIYNQVQDERLRIRLIANNI